MGRRAILFGMNRWIARIVFAVFALLLGATAGADPRWHIAKSGHLVVIGDGGEKNVLRVARELEQFREVFQLLLKSRVENVRPFLVLAARDEDSMRQLVPWYWERPAGKRPAGIFFGDEERNWAIVRGDLQNPTHVIFHEYAHLLEEQSLGPLPLWLSEGLAEFFGATVVEDDAVKIGAVMPEHLAWLRRGVPLPISQLVTTDWGSADYVQGKRASGFYSEAALLTHYLLLGDDSTHRAQLVNYLRLLKQGTDDHDALDRALGGSANLDLELRDYARRLRFPLLILSRTVTGGAISVRELRPAETAAFLGDFLLHTGQVKEARTQVELALRDEPDLGIGHLQRGRLLVAEGRRNEASSALAEARRLTPHDALVEYYFGTLASPPEADVAAREGALRSAIRLDPAFASARDALARLLLEEQRSPDEALGLAMAAVRLDPGSVSYRLTVLELESRMGCAAEAERDEQALVRIASLRGGALSEVIRHYESVDRLEEAEAFLRQVQARNRRNIRAAQRLASFLERHDRPNEAETVLREVLALEPQSDDLLNSLAYLNADRGVKLEEALALAEEALKIAPDQAAIQDTKAWALFRLGRVREAEEWTRKSLDATESVVVRDHLGDILEKQGRLGEAVGEWRRALANDNATDTQREGLKAKIARTETALKPSPAAGQ